MGSRKKRNPPVAQLETLGSTSVWCILLAPLFLTIIAVCIDLNHSIHVETMKFDISNCYWPLRCHLQDTNENHELLFQLLPPSQLLRHIHFSANIHGSLDLLESLPEYTIELIINAVNQEGNITQYLLDVTKKKRYFANGIELGGFTTDPPWFLEENTYMEGSIKISSTSSSVASDILMHSIFVLEYQRAAFTSLRAFTQVFLSLLSMVILVFWLYRLFLHHHRLRDSSPLSKTRKCCGCMSAYSCCLNYLLPEQIYTILMFICLILWLDFPGALIILIEMYVGYTNLGDDEVNFYISLIKVVGQQGLFFSFLILMSSIGCIPERKVTKGRRHSLESFFPSPEENDEMSPLLRGTSHHIKRYDDKEVNPRRFSDMHSLESRSNPDWLLEDDTSSSRPSRLSLQSRKSEVVEVSVSKSEIRRKSSSKHPLDDEYSLSRGYADLPDEPLPPLIKSHPCSGMWLEFLGNKLLILNLGLLIVLLQNLFMYPSFFSKLHFSLDRELELFLYCLITTFVVPLRLVWIIYICDAVIQSSRNLSKIHYMESRYQQIAFRLLVNLIVIGMILLGGTYVFTIYHFFASISKSFASDLSLGDIWIKSTITVDSGYGSWGGRASELGELFYVTCIVYIISLLFAAPLPSSYNNIYEHSEQGLAGTVHEYHVMEDSLSPNHSPAESPVPRRSLSLSDMLTPFLSTRSQSFRRKHFCLETACILMECTWQTYFEPLDEARTEEESAARSASKDIFASMLGTCVDSPMNILQYGLHFHRSFLSSQGDISGYICHSLTDNRIIIAFRGTVGGSNMVTDMNMLQIKLPNMKISKDDLDVLFRVAYQEYFEHSGAQSTEGIDDIEGTHDTPNNPSPLNQHANPTCFEQMKFCCDCCLGWLPLSSPLIHLGFWQAYLSIRNEFWKSFILTLLKLITSNQLSSEIYICGHSLGGALAVLAALDISMNLHLVLQKISFLSTTSHPLFLNPLQTSFTLIVYTFGAPRIGNIAFCQRVESIIPNLFRLEVDGDIICRMPSFFGLYRHCGVHIIIDSDEKGNLIVNPTVVETQLLRRSSGTTSHHTLSKYRECLEACFLPHELDEYVAKYYHLSTKFHSTKVEPSSKDLPIWL